MPDRDAEPADTPAGRDGSGYREWLRRRADQAESWARAGGATAKEQAGDVLGELTDLPGGAVSDSLQAAKGMAPLYRAMLSSRVDQLRGQHRRAETNGPEHPTAD